ncbi:Hypothetical predicted protein [Cloeon dipterum]|uniref:Uncharacterized protein n=1 Tax=Cloeon dipterum TaxID=197152 RepID=A0A8S1CZI7_9INSE|nr:Hypothetical predicted protein [Cloeon dipterum]
MEGTEDLSQIVEKLKLIVEDESANESKIASVAEQLVEMCENHIDKFMERPDLDPLSENEKPLLSALILIQQTLAENCKVFELVFLQSNLLNQLAKMITFYADITDFMVKDLSKACALEKFLCWSEAVPAEDIMKEALEIDQIPQLVINLCECRNVDLQHLKNCECLECIECEDVLAQETLPPQFRKPQLAHSKADHETPLMMESGKEGKIAFPLRCLQFHKAAICCVESYWSLLGCRSDTISKIIHSRPIPLPGEFWIGVGDMVAVASKEISWISYEPTSPTAPTLPEYVRAIILTDCPLPFRQGYRGLWLPDYAARALCKPSVLIPLERSDPIMTWKPLVYIGNACRPPPNELLAVVVNLIYVTLNSGKLEDILVILDGKGPWRAYQLIKSIDGRLRVEYLAILNALASHCEKGSRGLIACCIHNFLADWFVWLIHSTKPSNDELETLMDGINLYLPRIEVKRWPKSRLMYGAANALLKCCPSEKLHAQLEECIHYLTWDIGGRIAKNRRRMQPIPEELEAEDERLQIEALKSDLNENCKANLSLEKSQLTDFNMSRKQWPGETWLLPSRSTLSLFAIPEAKLKDAALVMRTKCPFLLRRLIYKPVVQSLNCEVMKVRSIRDIRQPSFAKIVCGMLNSGGGDIWIGLTEGSRVEGVFAHRSERDSFAQGQFCDMNMPQFLS